MILNYLGNIIVLCLFFTQHMMDSKGDDDYFREENKEHLNCANYENKKSTT